MYYDRLKKAVHTVAKAHKAANAARIPIAECIAPCYLPIDADIKTGQHTMYYFPGGRGSAKSSFCALEVVQGIMDDPEANGIVFRRYAATMRESTYSQIAWAIDMLGAGDLWKGNVSPMQFVYVPTGQIIHFRGVDDSAKIKSIKPRHGYYKFTWFEEFSEFDGPNQIRSVLQSVMRGGQDFRIFCSFNPPLSVAAWSNKHIQQPDERAIVFHTDYTMIPESWLGDGFIAEAEHLRAVNPEAFEHEYMGHALCTSGMVFPNVQAREITNEEIQQMQYFYCGCDWGFSSDPAAVVRASYDSRTQTVFILGEFVQRGCSNSQIAEFLQEQGWDKAPGENYFSPFGGSMSPGRQLVICDSAEPKSVADLQGMGIKATGCMKYPGSVQYGIRWLQSKTIVIDRKRTPYAFQEFTEYEYKRTKDGDILADVPDANNHTIDSLRYALDMLINNHRYTA